LTVLAGAVFLGRLGSVDLWGKREQRAAAEAIDTVDQHHWLVAQVQGRPRLEKPPLLRWSIAVFLLLTGRRDEWTVRLPGALSALATVALVYALGRRMGGYRLGLASALVLCSMGFFVGEMRQATSDAPLTLFTTLALYAAWRRLHDWDNPRLRSDSASATPAFEARSLTSRRWNLVFFAALGLGFLTKGPVILLLVAATLVPYLTITGRLAPGLLRLSDGWGMLLFGGLALAWPIAVLHHDLGALRVWSVEMSEKTGLWQILQHRKHALLPKQWPGLVFPWTLMAVGAMVLPFLGAIKSRSHGGESTGKARGWPRVAWGSSPLWFAWWWAMGNLGVFCFWAVTKPHYYLPCLPGMALLIGWAWVGFARMARGQGIPALAAGAILQAQWVLLFVAAATAPLVVRPWLPAALWPWSGAIALTLVLAVVASVHLWRRGADAAAIAPITMAFTVGVLIIYGIIAPSENGRRSHRALAQTLHRLMPPSAHRLMFFNEIDEGLWFYLSGLDIDLAPVPGSYPRYNTSYDIAASFRAEQLPFETLEAKRQLHAWKALIGWLGQKRLGSPYLLIRGSLYDRYTADLAGRAIPLYRETGMKRNELVLLQLVGDRQPAATAAASAPTAR
jgi:4-amino-4-deoxy-L-arabinose transferase-like glycosyltransferase